MRDLREEVRRRLAGTRIAPARALEIADEIGQDLEERMAELLARGVAPAVAEAEVLAELDDHDALARELARIESTPRPPPVTGAPGRGFLADLWGDLRHATRGLIKSPGFTAVTVLSLALGIGANTAIFQLIDAVHMRSLPVAEPEQLATVKIRDQTWASGAFYSWHADLTNPMWERIRSDQQAFDGVLAWGDGTFNLAPTGEVQQARGLFVSGGFFRTLGVPALHGRVFGPADDRRGCGAPGAVVSHAFWQRELGAQPDAVGQRLSIDGHQVEILGVTPASFYGLEVGRSFDVAVPICMDELLRGENNRLDKRSAYWLSVMGRLAPGWTHERAGAQLETISPALFADTVPEKYAPEAVGKYKAYRLAAYPAGNGISELRKDYSKPLYFLLATAGLVLLIACANLANLLLARASAREREIAVRLALGASRGRLIRQLMTESLLLGVIGAAAGLWLASALSQVMVASLSTRGNALFVDMAPDWRVLGFTAGLAGLTCLLFGLAPALRASRTDVGLVLKATGGHGATVARYGLRRLLVAAQVALSFVLLAGALLFTRSLSNLSTVETGFDQRGVLIMDADLRKLELPAEKRLAAQEDLLERVRAVPGVAAAGSSTIVPVSGNYWNHDVVVEGKKESQNAFFSRISPGYFDTMKMRLLAGRDFRQQDRIGAPTAAIVNQKLAAQMFPGQNPVGRRLVVEASSAGAAWTIDIVGMVQDSKYGALREERQPVVYVAAGQDPEPAPYLSLVLRPSGPLPGVVAGVKKAVSDASPRIVIDIDQLERVIRDSLVRERLMATLSGFFGLLAGLLAAVGLYGVVAYSVARRTHEIGIRMALGAGRRRIAWMITGETAALVGVGLAVGIPLALAATRAAGSMLYGLRPHDPVTFGMAAALLALVAMIAAAIPARRAAGVQPMMALKEE